ncbi:MAG: hypothetical protein RIK87_18790 [Fuerstiella sp.]
MKKPIISRSPTGSSSTLSTEKSCSQQPASPISVATFRGANVFANSRSELRVGHPVGGGSFNGIRREVILLKTLQKFAFGFTGPKNHQRVGILKSFEHFIVKAVE